MSNRYDDLILHLKLDDIDSTSTTPDSSQSRLKAKVNGATIVKDDTFGACLNFQGQDDHVEVSSVDLAGDNLHHTIEGWIKVEAYPNARSWLLLLGQANDRSHHWLLNTENPGDLGKKAQLGHWGLDVRHQAKAIIPLSELVHLATTFDCLNYICYVNGEAIDKQEHYKFTLTEKRLTLGKRGISTEKNFQGKMAHVQIYRRALSQDEIREDMDAFRDYLVLHLKLDDIDISTKTITTPDSSKSGLKGIVHGASLVADDTFGACLHFHKQNDRVEVPDLRLPGQNPAHTIESWIKVETYPEATSWMMLLGQNGPGADYWLLSADSVVVVSSVMSKVPLGEWVHIATSYDGHVLVGYLNGQPVHGPITTTFNLTDKRLTLAKRAIETEKNFQGKMAHVRVYRRALSEAEIREDMDSDKLALREYRRGHPIAFSLRDEDENYVLYIGDDPRDHHRLNLELRNTSVQAISFQKKGDTASEVNHHFELVFRNGVLSDKMLNMLRENKDKDRIVPEKNTDAWDVFSPGENNQSGTVSVFFLYKDTSKPFGFGQRLVVPLRKISANAGSGARGTRVELKLNQLTYVDETTPITGNRIQHLQIISHLGSRRAPLHVGFVGSNRILNDGSPGNELVLQLMNVLKSEGDTSVRLTTDSKDREKSSKFLISFDVQSDKEVAPWSLCTEKEIDALKDSIIVTEIHVVDSEGNPVSDASRLEVRKTDHGQGESPVWSVAPTQDIVLRRDDYIQIRISNIKTSLPSGLTNLYLDYKNIPGFWDGQVVCPIEKAPLLFYDVTYSASESLQDAIAALKNQRQELEGARDAELASATSVGRISVTDRFDAMLAANAADANTLAQLQNQPQKYTGELRVGIGCVKPKAKLEIALRNNDADKALLIRKGNVNYLTVLHDGKVGIGTPTPSFPLHMPPGKALRIDGGTSATDTGNYFSFGGNGTFGVDAPGVPNGRFVIDNSGKVGIGTSSPGAKLSIKGGLHVGGESDPGDTNLLVDGKATIVGGLHVGGGSDPGNKNLLVSGRASILGGGLHVGGESDPGNKNLLVVGKASIKGGLHVGAPLDGNEGLSVDSSLFVNGSGMFLGSLLARNSIGLLHTGTKDLVAEITVEPALVFKTHHGGKWHNSITVQPPRGHEPTLAVAGYMSERLDVIDTKGLNDWKVQNHPIMKYFSGRLTGKPTGTMLRAIPNYQKDYSDDWRGHWWTGWVDATGQIRVIHNYYNTGHIATPD